MQKTNMLAAVAVVVLVSIVSAGCVSIAEPPTTDEGIVLNFNDSQAISITMNDSDVADFMSRYYDEPDWRVTRTTLIQEVPEALNGTDMSEDNIWKVEIMERSCACQKISDIYVVESYISAETGELLHVEKMKVSERNYDKETCATTVCH
ncbi:hypothetical protein J2755_000572 [Methanohalophilus levihalophilus]|uniref:hypothetical protein n=1 Tax=Methanohalophilus levihalophilus TaxID=1431282 RepID=UPI001AE37311|nr:hypothetical protein [Methanohalophilus levihalophilus]MBP2029652.1 hypothetical protein [Methanohalophilus levihalophilus]